VFLVQLPPGQAARWLFLHCDPRADGCPFDAAADVELEDDGLALGGFDAEDFSEPVLGRSLTDRTIFKRFQSYERLKNEGFEYLPGPALELSSWRAFVRTPPVRGNATSHYWA
jgi:hypothetical protein